MKKSVMSFEGKKTTLVYLLSNCQQVQKIFLVQPVKYYF